MSDPHGAVHVHVHSVMAGAFPLRMADILFTDTGVVVPEYHHLTPLLGIARGKTHDVAETAVERYRREGVAGLVDMAEQTREFPYADLQRVRVYDGGGLGRPKVALDVTEGPPHAYRIHAPVDVEELVAALEGLGARRNFAVSHTGGLGFSPTASLRRFVAGR